MGADIHCFVEYRVPGSEHWGSFGREMSLPRNYRAFAKLAGVRGDAPVFEPRGIPDGELSYWARDAYYLRISDHANADDWDGFTTPEKAARWALQGKAYIYDKDGKPLSIEHPDWHTPTWLTGDEWRSVVGDLVYGQEYRAVGAAMRSLEDEGHETRAVFWFDN